MDVACGDIFCSECLNKAKNCEACTLQKLSSSASSTDLKSPSDSLPTDDEATTLSPSSSSRASDISETGSEVHLDKDLLDDEQYTKREELVINQTGLNLKILDVNNTETNHTPDDLGEGEVLTSTYGLKITPEQAASLCPPSTEGIIWHAQVVNKTYSHPRNTTAPGLVKPRRGIPTVLATDFFNSIIKTPDGRWIFYGVLNGWPSLKVFELLGVTCKVRRGLTGIRNYIKRMYPVSSSLKGYYVIIRAIRWLLLGLSHVCKVRRGWVNKGLTLIIYISNISCMYVCILVY